jgi:hypothetical protein
MKIDQNSETAERQKKEIHSAYEITFINKATLPSVTSEGLILKIATTATPEVERKNHCELSNRQRK